MINIIWSSFIIISVVFAIFTGNVNKLNNAIFTSAADAVQMSVTFFGTICLWTGLMNILENTSLINSLEKILMPIMKILFPKLKKEDKSYKKITLNIIANILGLGNAATPLGIEAMNSLQEKNVDKDILSKEMMMFIIINTASLQIIPSTVIAIRISLGSTQPTCVIIPIWIATLIADLTGIILIKFLSRRL